MSRCLPEAAHRAAPLVLVLLLAATAAPPAAADEPAAIERATFVLRSGEMIEDVPFSVDERFKVVILELPDGPRNVSFSDIESILVDGRGVTAQVLGHSPARQERQARSAQDPVYRSARTSPWKFGFRAGGSYSIPFGDWYEGIEGGIGFGIEALIPIKRRAAIRLCYSRAGIEAENRDWFVSIDPDVTITDQSVDLDADRYVLAVQVHRYLDGKGERLGMYYGYAGLGAIRHKFTFEVTGRRISDGTIVREATDSAETEFLTNLGGGVILMLNPRVGIDLAANLDMIWLSSHDDEYGFNTYAVDNAWILDLRAGAVLFF